MTLTQRVSLAAIALALPLSALAAPANVTGVRAEIQNNQIVVSWMPVEGDVAKYRVFYSHASILEQGGLYDDYEDTDGPFPVHTLKSIPATGTLYVSVLAVAADGSESPLFMEEAKVERDAMAQASSAEAASSAMSVSSAAVAAFVTEDSVLRFLSVEAVSSTGVTLTFSHPLSIPEVNALEAFTVKNGSGETLPIVRYKLDGMTVHLDTAQQESGRVYQVTIHPSIMGRMSTGIAMQEEGTAPLLFNAITFEAGTEVSNLRLQSKPATGGSTVTVSWTPPTGTFRELRMQQSTDGGKTFGAVTRLDKGLNSVAIPRVTSNQLTVVLKVVNMNGDVSAGVSQTVVLKAGGTASSVKNTTASSSSRASAVSSTPTTKPGTLPSSGIGAGLAIALSGAIAGMRMVRKKK